MRKLYLMCGLAFAGKTTLAKAIVARQNCTCVSLDDINRERGLTFGGKGLPVEEWEKTHQIALARLDELMRHEQDIILDDTNCLRKLRDRFRRVADRNGYQTKIIYFDIPADEIRQRMRRNEEIQERTEVIGPVFENLVRIFESPQPDEETLTFRHGQSFDDWVISNFPARGKN